ncbi:hypothetical protein TSUD_107520 [Trifolium subterraneum]|uniref:Uncharacterized protein n=1 Tax=Trifolium subterraneum TaxID=3900 RepID=A0A2Z6P7Z5_TRISU|nr:hypothetical protein TSUD_107520 [Trifolium subterraneum]
MSVLEELHMVLTLLVVKLKPRGELCRSNEGAGKMVLSQYEKPNGTQVVTTSERESQEASLGGDTMKVTSTIEKIPGLGDMNMEMDNEIFEDANDHGSAGTSDSDQEVVKETPGLEH